MTQTDVQMTAAPEAETGAPTPAQIFRQRLFGHTGFLIGAGLIGVIALPRLWSKLRWGA